MGNFNKYQFIENLTAEIKAEIEKGIISNIHEINRFIGKEISAASVYPSDCFAICISLGVTEFETGFGIATNVYRLAFDALLEFVYSEISLNELKELL